MQQRYLATLVCLSVVCACNTLDQDHELALEKFAVAACTKSADETQLSAGGRISDYPGLTCISWDLGVTNKVSYINVESGCGFGISATDESEPTLWRGAMTRTREDVRFAAKWNFSDPSACGACRNTFSFETQEPIRGPTVQLVLAVSDCRDTCGWAEQMVDVDVARQPTGTSCRYTNADQLRAMDTGSEVGKPNGPPGAAGCMDGTVEIHTPAGQRCASRCASDEDCHPDGILKCTDGVCKLED